MARPDLVTVGWAYGQGDAAVAMSLLEAAGVRVMLDVWHIATFQWHLTHALGGIAFQVPASEAETARTILEDFRPLPGPRNRLLCLLFAVLVIAISGFPSPPSGFFPAARPAAGRQQEPLQP